MKKYSDYKNSSVPWIGEIPTTWNLSQLRYVIECLDGKRVPVELSLRADNKKDAKKAERKLSRREWRIAVISAIIGGMVGLIPWICTLIGGGQ